MLIDGIIALLSSTSSVSTLATGGVYENELPRGYTLPAICVHQYGGDQGYDMGGPDTNAEKQVQLDVYGVDGATCRAVATAANNLLKGYVGTLPDGTVVQGCFLEKDMAFPFMAKADIKGIANRWMLGYRVTAVQ